MPLVAGFLRCLLACRTIEKQGLITTRLSVLEAVVIKVVENIHPWYYVAENFHPWYYVAENIHP